MSSIRESLIRRGLLTPADPAESSQAKQISEQNNRGQERKKKIKSESSSVSVSAKVQPHGQGKTQARREPLEHMRPLPKSEKALNLVIHSMKSEPKMFREKIRWLIYTQEIYLNGANISKIREKTAIELLTQFERDLRKLAKYWQEVAYSVNYRPNRYSSDIFKLSWQNLCETLQSGKGIENQQLKDYAIKFLKSHVTELTRKC